MSELDTFTDGPHTQERKPIWETDRRLSCPIIGVCLSFSDQKKILKKTRVSLNGMSDFDIHATLTQGIGSTSPLSRRVQRCLDKKYRRQVADLGACSEAEFFSLWREGLKSGEVAGLLWVAATNPNLSEQAIGQVFADVHMMMHGQGETVRRRLQQVEQLDAANKKLSDKLRDARKRAHEATQTLHTLERECAELERTVQAQRAENEVLEHDGRDQRLRKENETLVAQLEKMERRFQAQATTLDRVKAENDRLVAELGSQDEINQLMRAEVECLLQEMLREEAECETCPNRDLCDQRVLLVGGITKLSAFYRDLVEATGGEFRYHDGYTSGGERALQNLIGWADVILCPVDVNSHRACLCVKKICKRLSKPYHMLTSSSVSILVQDRNLRF